MNVLKNIPVLRGKKTGTPLLPPGYVEAALVFVYACLTAVIISRHAPWRDETDTWVAVKDLSLRDLFGWYIKYTGHPGLWPMMLMPFAKAGLPIGAEYIVHWLVAVAMVAVFIRFSPFSLLTKMLWAFSMPIAYEYAVIARNYSLTVLMLFIVAALYARRFDRPFVYACAVFFLMQTHALVFMTGCALALCYGLELRERRKTVTRSQIAAWGLMALAILVTLCELMPPAGLLDQMQVSMHHNPWLNPLFIILGDAWWNGSWALYGVPMHQGLHHKELYQPNGMLFLQIFPWFCIPLSMLCMTFCLMIKKPYQGLIFLLSVIWFVYIETFKYTLAVRHHMLLVDETFFALWIAQDPSGTLTIGLQKIKSALTAMINLCLFYSCIQTPFYYYLEYYEPYSASRHVAQFLKDNHLENRILVTDTLFSIIPFLDDKACIWQSYIGRCERIIKLDKDVYWKFFFKETSMFGGTGSEEGNGTMGSIGLRRATEKFGDLAGKIFITPMPLSPREIKQYGLVLVYNEGVSGNDEEAAWVYMPEKDFRHMLETSNFIQRP